MKINFDNAGSKKIKYLPQWINLNAYIPDGSRIEESGKYIGHVSHMCNQKFFHLEFTQGVGIW